MFAATHRNHLYGLLIVIVIGSLSWLLGTRFPKIGSVTIAIILGIIVGNAVPQVRQFAAGFSIADKRLLPIAIALLGVELQLVTLLQLGWIAVLVIVVSILTSIFLAVHVGEMLGYSRNFSLLMGAGNGICGSSAVAATSMVVDASEDETGISISVVNLLGTLGIFLLPALARIFGLSDGHSGLLIGGTLQAVGQVVAAGYSMNMTVGAIATVVKMGRVLMLGPIIVMLIPMLQNTDTPEKSKARVRIPLFIVGFFALSLLASLQILPSASIGVIKVIGKYLLVLAMCGIGLNINISTLLRSAPSAVLFGMMVWFVQILVVILLLSGLTIFMA